MGRKGRAAPQLRSLAAAARQAADGLEAGAQETKVAGAPGGAPKEHAPHKAPMPLPRTKKATAEIPRIHIRRPAPGSESVHTPLSLDQKAALAKSREYWQKLPPLRPAPRVTPVGPAAPPPAPPVASGWYAPAADAPAPQEAQHVAQFAALRPEEEPSPPPPAGAATASDGGDYDSYSGNGYDGYEPPKRRRRRKGKRTFFRVMCIALCAALLVGAVLGGLGYSYAGEATRGDESALDLDLLKANGGLVRGTVLYAQDPAAPGEWRVYQRLNGQVGGAWQALGAMPAQLPAAVLAIEQPHFYTQTGAAVGYTLQGALFGAADRSVSTIEQQLARRLMQGRGPQEGGTLKRKLREISWAWMLGGAHTKDAILEAYLNTLQFTGGAVGVDGAAQLYFGKAVQQLTLAECATIAGLIYAPYTYDPFTHPDACLARRNVVLQCMRDQGVIDTAACEAAQGQPLALAPAPAEDAPANVFTWFTDLVYHRLVFGLMAEFGMDREAASAYLYDNDLKVYTTVDTQMQAYAERLYAEDPQLLGLDTDADQGAMVVLDYSGRVCAVVGGAGPKVASLVFNRASQSLVSPGAALRPVTVYAQAIETGAVHYSTLVQDAALSAAELGLDKAQSGGVREWPQNLEGKPSGDEMLLCDAFAQMTNTVAARIGAQVGIEAMYAFAQNQAGISSLASESDTTDKNLAALALGNTAYGVSLMELAAAYQMFGNGGQYHEPRAYHWVSDAQNCEVLRTEGARWQAIGADTAWVMQRLLCENLRAQSGAAPAGVQAAGCFGWGAQGGSQVFVGMTPDYVTAVWRGQDEPAPQPGGGAQPDKSAVLRPWQQVMEHAATGRAEFDAPPEGAVRAEYCADTGLLACEGCPRVALGAYTAAHVPGVCEEHKHE